MKPVITVALVAILIVYVISSSDVQAKTLRKRFAPYPLQGLLPPGLRPDFQLDGREEQGLIPSDGFVDQILQNVIDAITDLVPGPLQPIVVQFVTRIAEIIKQILDLIRF